MMSRIFKLKGLRANPAQTAGPTAVQIPKRMSDTDQPPSGMLTENANRNSQSPFLKCETQLNVLIAFPY
jgi:hypothetical protein